MNWITAADIQNWTSKDPRRAQETLPKLVGKLILASCQSIIDFHFPFGEAIQYSGYDGFLETNDSSPFFPSGKSVWEIGTDVNIRKKFNDDYNKRTREPNGICQAEITFCFVTSRIWNSKQGIVEATEEKISEGIWKRVRIIDAVTLELWLDRCSTVCSWFSEIIGKSNRGIKDLQTFWRVKTEGTEPRLNYDFFMFQRNSIIEQLNASRCGGFSKVMLVADSTLEALLCIASEILSTDDLNKTLFGEKCIVVDTEEAFTAVKEKYSDVVIIPTFWPTSIVPDDPKNTIVITVSRFSGLEMISDKDMRIEIPTRSYREFTKALEVLGYEAGAAYEINQEIKCSFMSLYRMLQTDPLKKIPEWINNEESTALIPALLAGSWEEQSIGDQQIISKLAGTEYDEYIQLINKYTTGDIKQIYSHDGFYFFLSAHDNWPLLLPKIGKQILNTFIECVHTVFSEVDPTYDLSEDKWYLSQIFGKRSLYSEKLKKGIASSLVILSGCNGAYDCNREYRAAINHSVKRILTELDTLNKWRSISPYLTFFFEAAPDIILDCLDKVFIEDSGLVWELFHDSDDPLYGRTFYPYILSIIEKAMWDNKYASHGIKLLVEASENTVLNNMNSGPEWSLYKLFCIWKPQGIFNLEERKILLADIFKNHHSIAPKLFKELMQPGYQTTITITKPKWWVIDDTQTIVTKQEVNEIIVYLLSKYLDFITPSYQDWEPVISDLRMFTDNLSLITEKCKEQACSFSKIDILALCKELAQFISRSRCYKHDSEEIVSAIESLYFDILPDMPEIYAHYFTHSFKGFNPVPFNSENYDFEKERAETFKFQSEKIQEMISQYGKESVISIVPEVEDNAAYAAVLTEEIVKGVLDIEFLLAIKEKSPHIAATMIYMLYNKNGLDYLKEMCASLTASDWGWALGCIPINEEITDYIASFDDEDFQKVYWENVRVWGIRTENVLWVNRCVEKLLSYKRPYTIIDCLSYSDWNEPELIIKTLKEALLQFPSAEPTGLTLEHVGNSDVERMFTKLYSIPSTSEIEIARLEFAYINAFDYEFKPKCLLRQILTSPDIYFELLEIAFLEDGKKASEDKSDRRLSLNAKKVLDRITVLPGYSEDTKEIDDMAFKKWVSSTKKLTSINHYSKAHDIILGRIMSYSPVGRDGFWPAECVREVFETNYSETLEIEFIIGKENQRGVYSPSEGAAEKRLAEEYKRISEGIQFQYPRTASIIRKLSENYLDEANKEYAREFMGY